MKNQLKYELQNLLSGNESIGAGNLIQTIAHYLKKSKRTSTKIEKSEFTKEQENQILIPFIQQNSLWINDIAKNRYLTEGAEQKVYLTQDKKSVLKVNTTIFYAFWEDYFNNLMLHNFFFPSTKYDLIGFIQENDNLHAVVKQVFVQSTSPTNLENVKDFLYSNGFENNRNNDYQNKELGIILEDLHDENVLTSNNVLMFIDTVFYITDNFYKI